MAVAASELGLSEESIARRLLPALGLEPHVEVVRDAFELCYGL